MGIIGLLRAEVEDMSGGWVVVSALAPGIVAVREHYELAMVAFSFSSKIFMF